MGINLLVIGSLLVSVGQAYIPRSKFIFEKLAEQHGKGTFSIEQEVIISSNNLRETLKENWIVVDGGEMRVSATGSGIRLLRILKKGRVSWLDEKASERSDILSDENFMVPLIIRTPAELAKFFTKWKIVSPDLFKDKKPPKDIKDIKVDAEPNIRLARMAGAVAWAFGTPAPVDSAPTPGLWVHQDEFVIRKMRSPTGAEFYGNEYAQFSNGFMYPKTQVISFSGTVAAIRVLKISRISLTNEVKKQMEASALRTQKNLEARWGDGPLAPVISEFYKRFR